MEAVENMKKYFKFYNGEDEADVLFQKLLKELSEAEVDKRRNILYR